LLCFRLQYFCEFSHVLPLTDSTPSASADLSLLDNSCLLAAPLAASDHIFMYSFD
jgi:hypothetical protein